MPKLAAVIKQPPFNFIMPPWAHQRDALRRMWGKLSFALFMEMRTGKTKIICDEARALSDREEISCLIVIAPHGMYGQWIDQWRMHSGDSAQTHVWRGGSSKRELQQIENMLKTPQMLIIAFNYDTLITDRGYKMVEHILVNRKTMLVLDEAHHIKTPGAKRTKRAIKLAQWAVYRRILTGTPVSNSPLDVFTLFQFLNPKVLGYSSFWAFRARYAVLETKHAYGRSFVTVKRDAENREVHQHLDELKSKIAPFSFSITAAECLDLPARQYLTLPVDLSPQQRRMYDELTNELTTRLDTGEEMSAPLAIVQLMRLQQLLSGIVTPDEGRIVDMGDGHSAENIRLNPESRWLTEDTLPREKVLLDYLEDVPGKVIIWCRFVPERQRLYDLLSHNKQIKNIAIKVEGERAKESVDHFKQHPDCRFLIASPDGPASEGVDLSCAQTMIYYSNSFRLTSRMQSEARCEHRDKKRPVTIVDLVAQGTVDERVVQALSNKKELAKSFNGQELRKWLK